jgi:hypothetical protein
MAAMSAHPTIPSALLLAAALLVLAGCGADAGGPTEPGDAVPASSPTLAPAPVPTPDGARLRYPADRPPPRLALPGGETRPIASVLRIETPMRYGDHVWNTEGVPPGPTWVRVDLARQILSVFRGGHEIGSAVILYGAEGKPTPHGRFPILQKAADYHSRTYDAPMPFMLRLTDDGVAIHGSEVREGRATHGCIGVPEPFARRLFPEMNLGDTVFIVG